MWENNQCSCRTNTVSFSLLLSHFVYKSQVTGVFLCVCRYECVVVCVCVCVPTQGWFPCWCHPGHQAEPGSEAWWRHRWLWPQTSASSGTPPTPSSAPGMDQSHAGPSLTNKCPGCLEAPLLPDHHRHRWTGPEARITPGGGLTGIRINTVNDTAATNNHFHYGLKQEAADILYFSYCQ